MTGVATLFAEAARLAHVLGAAGLGGPEGVATGAVLFAEGAGDGAGDLGFSGSAAFSATGASGSVGASLLTATGASSAAGASISSGTCLTGAAAAGAAS
jgi:hypothetical protein